MHSPRVAALLALLLFAPLALSQTIPDHPFYTRLNTFGLFGEYANDSSHLLFGYAQNRKLIDFGGSYSRRLLLNRIVDGQYLAEISPIMFESDPLWRETITSTPPLPPPGFPPLRVAQTAACHKYSVNYTVISQGVSYSITDSITCGQRQWTFGEGISPLGIKANFLPRRRVQPVLTILGGYMFATRPIPVSDASSANFTFSVGAGLELYRSFTRSIRTEYRYHHISNGGTADNPGIDNQLLQITYNFGR